LLQAGGGEGGDGSGAVGEGGGPGGGGGEPVLYGQGLTLVHFSAQRKPFLWDRGCSQGLFRGCSGVVGGLYRRCLGIRGCLGCILCQKRLRLS